PRRTTNARSASFTSAAPPNGRRFYCDGLRRSVRATDGAPAASKDGSRRSGEGRHSEASAPAPPSPLVNDAAAPLERSNDAATPLDSSGHAARKHDAPSRREATRASRQGYSEPVNEYEQPEPNDVDKVPVPRHGLEREMPLRREMAAQHAQPYDEQHDRSDQHVEAVEAGQHEERRPVNAGRIEAQAEILIGVDVLFRLEAEEQEAEQERRREPDLQAEPLAGAQHMVRDRQGHTARQQNRRVQRRHAPRRNRLELRAARPRGRPCVLEALPQQDVREEVVTLAREPGHGELPRVEERAEEGPEEHDLREDEPGHAPAERPVDLVVVEPLDALADDRAEPAEQHH